jgi:hypothetical protein
MQILELNRYAGRNGSRRSFQSRGHIKVNEIVCNRAPENQSSGPNQPKDRRVSAGSRGESSYLSNEPKHLIDTLV